MISTGSPINLIIVKSSWFAQSYTPFISPVPRFLPLYASTAEVIIMKLAYTVRKAVSD